MHTSSIILLLLLTASTVQAQDTPALPDSCLHAGDFALTFDDGPSEHTGRLLKYLRDQQVHATFHIVIKYIQQPVVLANARQALLDGHTLGLRIDPQLSLLTTSDDDIKKYLQTSMNTMKRLLGVPLQFVRVNVQDVDERVVRVIQSLGLVVTLYNLDSMDYTLTPGDTQTLLRAYQSPLEAILPPAKGSFISVQHDLTAASVDSTPSVLKYVKEKGYKLVTMHECLGVQVPQYEKPVSGPDATPYQEKSVGETVSMSVGMLLFSFLTSWFL